MRTLRTCDWEFTQNSGKRMAAILQHDVPDKSVIEIENGSGSTRPSASSAELRGHIRARWQASEGREGTCDRDHELAAKWGAHSMLADCSHLRMRMT